MPDRSYVRRLAAESIANDDPVGWFEQVYLAAEQGETVVPWADGAPNPHLVSWAGRHGLAGRGERALVVGCGLGDDAEALAGLGFAVVAFDVAPTAVRNCRARFGPSAVEYVVADLLAPPADWAAAFQFVFEAYTLQSLPGGPVRRQAIAALSGFVAPGGHLLVVARGRDQSDPSGDLPWPLTRAEVMACATGGGMATSSFDDFLADPEHPGPGPKVRRFVAAFARAGGAPPADYPLAMDAQHTRGRLADERERLQAIKNDLDSARDDSKEESAQELSSYSQHQADIGTETFERERDLSILSEVEGELADVEHALQRLDDGSYGTCEACGRPVGDDRLEAMPATRFCLEDQARAEYEGRTTEITE